MMENNAFGKLVQEYREARTYRDGRDILRILSRRELSQRSGISVRRIRRIEEGKEENLEDCLEPLSLGLELTEPDKKIFYATAGHIYRNEANIVKDSVRDLLQQLPFPASARTPMWDFIAFNEYHRCIRGITSETVDAMQKGVIYPNILTILFDPDLQEADYTLRRGDDWQAKAVHAFRTSAAPYAKTPEYIRLIDMMEERYESFKVALKQSPTLYHQGNDNDKRNPISQIEHPDFGLMEFLSFRSPARILGDGIDIAVYVPMISSEGVYRKFRDRINEDNEGGVQKVYFFVD